MTTPAEYTSCPIPLAGTESEALPPAADGNWYVAVVRSSCEKLAASHIARVGIPCWLPTRKVKKQYSRQKRPVIVDVVALSNYVFFRCKEGRYRDEENPFYKVVDISYVYKILQNPMTGERAIIPDEQVEQLRQLLAVADETFLFTAQRKPRRGDRVRVVSGRLAGFVGKVRRDTSESGTWLYIDVDYLGCAMVKISPEDVEFLA